MSTQPTGRLGSTRAWPQWLAAALVLMLSPALANDTLATNPHAGLEIGIAPFLPTRTLIQNYRPLREYLEDKLGEPVLVVTAADYRTFHMRIRDHQYPLVIAVANSAYLAHVDSGYQPLLKPKAATCPVLVVAKDSPVKDLRGLRGQTLALPDPLAVISMQAKTWLHDAELVPDKDLKVQHLPTHGAAINYVVTGQVAAAIVSDRALQQLAPDLRAGVRIAERRDQVAVPGILYLADPRLPPARVQRLKELVLEFSDTPVGRKLMRDWGYEKLIPATREDLLPLAPYGEQLRSALAEDETPAAE